MDLFAHIDKIIYDISIWVTDNQVNQAMLRTPHFTTIVLKNPYHRNKHVTER